MEELEKKGRGINYDHSKIADKHYFGGYLNLAQNNIDAVFAAFANRLGLKSDKLDNIGIINNYLSDRLSTPDYLSRIDFLKQYFPVVHFLNLPITDDRFKHIEDEKKDAECRKMFRDNFCLLLKAIKKLRNFYTHHYHAPLTFGEELYSLLDNVFLSVVHVVKKDKMKDDKTRHLLKKELNTELSQLEIAKEAKLKLDKANGMKVSLDKVSIKNAVLNDAFYHLLYKNDEVNRNYKSRFTCEEAAENSITLSQSALLFLLGMFLSKKEGEDLRSRVEGFKGKVVKNEEKPININNNSLKFMATHWVFGHLGFKGLKHRLSTGFSKETLLIQIVDELSKVPDEVYRNFTKEQQESFIEDINEYIKTGNVTDTLEESIVVHPVIRKRYEDKFNYFVLRYLDEFADFPTLRFQVHIGNYVHDKRTKNIEGTHYQTDRVVKEKIKVFGKLSEVTNVKSNFITTTTNNESWEIYPNPSYNFVSNNIPVFINLQKSSLAGAGKLFSEILKIKESIKEDNINRRECKATKEQITHLIDNNIKGSKFKDIYIGEPTAILSLNELPALLYELLVNKKSAKDIENMLVEKLIARFSTIRTFKHGDKLPTSQITKKLLKSSGIENTDTKKLINAIKAEITITDEKLLLIADNRRELKEKKNGQPKRKFVFTNKELGQEAKWLADDLKRFMPKASRENWRGQHHSQLQQSLAYFNQKPKEAFSLLKEFWDFDDDSFLWNENVKHAFISSKSFDNLYSSYLNNRKELLTNMLAQTIGFKDDRKRLKQFTEQHHVWNLFYKRLYTIDPTESQIAKLLAKPLVFPRGIFDEKPTYIKGKSISENPELYANWYRYSYQQHDLQRFYEYSCDYKDLFESRIKTDNEITENKYELTKEQQFNLFKQKQDKQIKQVKTQDLYLKLIAEDVFQKIFQYRQVLNLKDFYLTQEERLAKEKMALIQSERESGNCSDNIIRDNYIWSMTVPFKDGQINEPYVKLKDIGKFKRFLLDKKVERIFLYDTNRIWTKLELEQELELLPASYEVIRREELLKELQGFEQFILQKWDFDKKNHPLELQQGKHPNFKCYVANGILERFNLADAPEVKWIKSLNEQTFEEVSITDLKAKPEIVQKVYLLVMVRNKFVHNQLPAIEYYELIKQFVTKDDCSKSFESYSSFFLEFVKCTIGELKSITP